VTTTSPIYRYVLQRRQRGDLGRRWQLAMRESAVALSRVRIASGGVDTALKRPEGPTSASPAWPRRHGHSQKVGFPGLS
jgi:hypothetical protein